MKSKSTPEGEKQRWDAPYCPQYHQAVELIGRRWTGAILLAMLRGRDTFTGIRCAVPGLSDRLLSGRLVELTDAGVARRTVLDQRPVAVEYRLTPKGEALGPVIASIVEWSEQWGSVR